METGEIRGGVLSGRIGVSRGIGRVGGSRTSLGEGGPSEKREDP